MTSFPPDLDSGSIGHADFVLGLNHSFILKSLTFPDVARLQLGAGVREALSSKIWNVLTMNARQSGWGEFFHAFS